MQNILPGSVAVAPGSSNETVRQAPSSTILIADDETAIRKLFSRILQDHGYQVLEAEDGVAALEVAQRHHGPIHLLLTDWRMPRLAGAGLIRSLAATHPETAILIVSGYLDTELPLNVAILRKPFRVADLAKKVRDVLEFRP
jgi:CheY-like chemotaxis protein